MNRDKLLPLGIVLLVVVAVGLGAAMLDEDAPLASAADEPLDPDWDEDDLFGLDEPDVAPRARPGSDGPRPGMRERRERGMGWDRGERGMGWDRGDRGDRGRRLRDMSDEERQAFGARRRERVMARVDVAPLGPSEDNPTPETVAEMLGDLRRGVRECMREADVPREAWRGARAEEREMSFIVGPDGRVDPETFRIEPALPAEIQGCFVRAAGTLTSPSRGEGAEVGVTMPSRRGRGRGDMGVPRRR